LISKQGDLHDLFEKWVSADEDWRKTELFVEISEKKGKVNADTRDWLSISELQGKLGVDGAASMIKFLEENEPLKCRDHPDAPGIKDTLGFGYRW